jgi:hypothetical protein
MGKLKATIDDEMAALIEDYYDGLLSDEEFDRLQKAYLRAALLKAVA